MKQRNFRLPAGSIPLALFVLSLLLWACSDPQLPTPGTSDTDANHRSHQEKGTTMSTQRIVERILAKDWDILEPPTPIDSGSAEAIAKLLDHEDHEVRELSVHALHLAGGPLVGPALLKTLDDPDDMTRGAACRFLRSRLDPKMSDELLRQLARSEDEYVREHVALMLGQIGKSSAIKPLETRFETEDRPHAKQAISLALARLKDPEHRKAYLARLEGDDPKERAHALEDLAYLDDKSLLKRLRPLLDDQREAKNVGPSHGPYWIRVCDVCVNVLDPILNHPFPFPISAAKRYSNDELAEAAKLLP